MPISVGIADWAPFRYLRGLLPPRSPQDANLLLVITYKNWAALGGTLAKGDAVAKEVMGSVAAANQAQGDRAIRTLLGSENIQELMLK